MELSHLIRSYRPINPQDADLARRFLQFVESNPLCFDRTFYPGHLTGSAWLVDPALTSVLLTHHKKLNKWLQLGGHADGDRDLLAVTLREAREESGLLDIRPLSTEIFDLDIHRISPCGTEPEHFHYDVRFALQCAGDPAFRVSDESHDLAWIQIDEMAKLTQEKSLLRMAEKWHKFEPLKEIFF